MINSISSGTIKQSTKIENNEANNIFTTKYLKIIGELTKLQLDIRGNLVLLSNGKLDKDKAKNRNKEFGEKEIIKKMNQEAQAYYNIAKFDFNIVEVCIIYGALVIIYDSSNKKDNEQRGWHENQESNGIVFSKIFIDINPNKRADGVTPTTSLHHELQHHINATIGDYLVKENLNLESFQRGKNVPFGFKSRADFVSNDANAISELFGREVDLKGNSPIVKTDDYKNYINQMAYFDELSASYGQTKTNIFGPNQAFYNNLFDYPEGSNHYDLVGSNYEDKKLLKKLFQDFLMPGLYLFEGKKIIQERLDNEKSLIYSDNVDKSIQKAKILEHEEKIKKIDECIGLIVQTLGLSRTVNQAYSLMEKIWNNRIARILSDNQLNFINKGGELLHKFL